MYQYIYLQNNVACEFIPEENPLFPGVPISERYAPDFLALCLRRSTEQITAEGIKPGMVYDEATDSFAWPPEPEPSDEDEENEEVTE